MTVAERASMRRTLLGVTCVAVAYFVVGWAGLLLSIPPGYATAIWPAAGIAVGALILYGYRLWPGVMLGSFLVDLSTGNDLAAVPGLSTGVWVALGIGAGAAAHAVIAACFARRVLARDPGLVRARSICLFLGLAGPLACMVSATWGVGMLWASGAVPPGELAFNWATWWVGDTVGVVLVTPLVLIFLSRQRAAWSRRRITVTVPLALALVAAIAGYALASNQELARIKLEFERSAAVLGNNLERQLGRYIESLEALKRHINTSHYIDRASFRAFVLPTLEELPGLLAVGWNPVVAGEELPRFEASARAEGISNFQVRERNAAGELVPATPRPVHVAVRYIVPLAGNEAAVGFDVYSNAARRAALDEARDSGRPVATARILLVQERQKRAGGLVFVPTYADPEEPETVAARRRALIGYSTGVLRFRDAVAVAVSHLGTGDFDVRVYDDSDSVHDTPLVALRIGAEGDSTDLAADAEPGRSGLAWSRRIDFAGRDWRLEVIPGPAYLGGQRSLLPWGVLAAGLAFVSLLGAFLLILTGRAIRDADRADELADLNAALNISIEEHQRSERALNVEKERALVTLHSIGDGVITTASDGSIEYLNPVAEALTGWKDIDARGRPLAEVFCIINEETRKPAMDPVQRCRQEGRVIGLENHTLLISRSGREHAIQDSAAPIRDRDGRMLGVILVFHDVTETRRMAREAAHYASHDSLTGLVNRREFDRRLEQALAGTKEYGSQHALCYLDLDQFKIVNDTSGHHAGDELLKLIASLLGHEVRERDTLARLGGDEFGLLLNNCPMNKAREIAETLVAAVDAFDFAWDGRAFKVGASVGLVSITSDSASAEDLLSKADVACYAAKDAGRNRVHVYRSSDAGPDPSHREILRMGDLRGALDANRFELHGQPIFRVTADGAVLERHELLLRMLDADDRPIAASDFIPAAERYGFMDQIDRWVVRAALRDRARLFPGVAEPKMSINLSGNSLNDDGLIAFLREQFAEHGVSPQSVCFEITETGAVRNISAAANFIEAVRDIGCELALDDFGSGLSSFAYLKALPVAYLKIDGDLVRNVANDPNDQAMVETINELAHRLGKQTVAEYVESPDCLRFLIEEGVDFVQGFALGHPGRLPR